MLINGKGAALPPEARTPTPRAAGAVGQGESPALVSLCFMEMILADDPLLWVPSVPWVPSMPWVHSTLCVKAAANAPPPSPSLSHSVENPKTRRA